MAEAASSAVNFFQIADVAMHPLDGEAFGVLRQFVQQRLAAIHRADR